MKKAILSFLVLSISSVYFLGCKKDSEPLIGLPIEFSQFSIDEAKTSFARFLGSQSNLGTLNSNFEPIWSDAIVSEDKEHLIIECPIKSHKVFIDKPNYKRTAVDIIRKPPVNRILFLKNKKNGIVSNYLVNYNAYKDDVYSESFYNNISGSFSGIVSFKDLNSSFVNGWGYENGKVVSKLLPKVYSISNRVAPDPSDCEDVIIDTYERDCYFFADQSMNYCTEWQYVGSFSVTSCPASGGGGVLTSEQVQDELFDFKLKYELSSTSYLDEIVNLSESAIERTKDYKWICGESSLLKAKSLEYGVHQKVNNQWKWKSLTHQDIILVGTVIGGTVSIVSESGLAQIGQFYSSMHVDFSVHYSVIIPNVSPISWDFDYGSTKYFNVND